MKKKSFLITTGFTKFYFSLSTDWHANPVKAEGEKHAYKTDDLFQVKQYDIVLTLSRRRPLSYRNQSIDLQSKSMDWFLYDRGPRHVRVKYRK